jgi:hypothetical protein
MSPESCSPNPIAIFTGFVWKNYLGGMSLKREIPDGISIKDSLLG